MFFRQGHEVHDYGHEASDSACTEHITVTTHDDLKTAYEDKDYSKSFYDHDRKDHAHQTFYKNTVPALKERLPGRRFYSLLVGHGSL